MALEHRRLFKRNRVKVMNIISGPGAGKTSLLEQTIRLLNGRLSVGVIEGDIQTTRDAERIAAAGAKAVQIETKGACHLDGSMIAEVLPAFDLAGLDLVVIENVGNLVCPVEFDLGEDMKVAVLSVAEGDDKPSKYPLLFKEAEVLVINKIDLLPHVDCDVERILETTARLNPKRLVFSVSCRTGEGLDKWVEWLEGWAGKA